MKIIVMYPINNENKIINDQIISVLGLCNFVINKKLLVNITFITLIFKPHQKPATSLGKLQGRTNDI